MNESREKCQKYVSLHIQPVFTSIRIDIIWWGDLCFCWQVRMMKGFSNPKTSRRPTKNKPGWKPKTGVDSSRHNNSIGYVTDYLTRNITSCIDIVFRFNLKLWNMPTKSRSNFTHEPFCRLGNLHIHIIKKRLLMLPGFPVRPLWCPLACFTCSGLTKKVNVS